jgi:hypothetical protein
MRIEAETVKKKLCLEQTQDLEEDSSLWDAWLDH